MSEYSLKDLERLHDTGLLSHLDYYFAITMASIFKDATPLTTISAALVSQALTNGHVCLDLNRTASTIIHTSDGTSVLTLPGLTDWVSDLCATQMVALEEKQSSSNRWISRQPLILDRDNNLYLAKYYDFQCRLARNIRNRTENHAGAIDQSFIAEGVNRHFSDHDSRQTAGQQEAVKKALTHNFAVISGGPGTGKTYITDIICSLLDEWAQDNGLDKPQVISLAPTGKAASRLSNGATIHSVLKPKKEGVGFLHTQDNPLIADMVIVDEASMIDIALMTRLLEAIPLNTRVVLLGDKDQLSPVQAGAVFTDICQAVSMAGYRTFLEFNFRSKGKTGIENLARAVNESDKIALTQILTSGKYADVVYEDTGHPGGFQKVLKRHIISGYKELTWAQSADHALAYIDRFRILCAHNSGINGTLQINHLCEKVLRASLEDGIKGSVFKQLLMVRQNDYHKGLFNGDTGVVMQVGNKAHAWFAGENSELREFRVPDLPSHDPAFAVTIHKSQGSEFDTVLILIPERISPVVTRQLLYTGITRARKKVVIIGRLDIIQAAMETPVERRSNLVAVLDDELAS